LYVVFYSENFNFLFKRAPFREKTKYRKNPTYVSCRCYIKTKKILFFVPGPKLRRLRLRPWTYWKKRRLRRNAGQPPFWN